MTTVEKNTKIKIGQLMKTCHTGTHDEIDNVFDDPENIKLFKNLDTNLLNVYIDKYPDKTSLILTKLKLGLKFINQDHPKNLLQHIMRDDNKVIFNHLLSYFGQEAVYNLKEGNRNLFSVALKYKSNKISSFLIDNMPASVFQEAEKILPKKNHENKEYSYSHHHIKFEESDINSLGTQITQGKLSSNAQITMIEKILARYKKEHILPNWHFVYALCNDMKYTNFDINQQFFKLFKDELHDQHDYIQKSIQAIQFKLGNDKVIPLFYTFKELANQGLIKINFELYGDKSYEKQLPQLVELIKVYPLILKKEDAFKINKAKHLDIFLQAINQPGKIENFEAKFSQMLLKNSDLDNDKFNYFIHALKDSTTLFNDEVLKSYAYQLIVRDKHSVANFFNFSETLKMLAQQENKEKSYTKLFYTLLVDTQQEQQPEKQENLVKILEAITDIYPSILYGTGEFSFKHKKTPKDYHFVSFAIQSNNIALCKYLLDKIAVKQVDEEYLIDIRRAIFRVSNKEEFQALYEKFYFEQSMQIDIQEPKKTRKI